MSSGNFDIWVGHSAVSHIQQEKEEAEKGKDQFTGYHIDIDLEGESLEEFLRNLIVDYVEIGYSFVTGSDEQVTGAMEEIFDLDSIDEDVKFHQYESDTYVQEVIPVPGDNYHLPFLRNIEERAVEIGENPSFYVEAEGQGRDLDQAIEEAELNAEMGVEINNERYNLDEFRREFFNP